MAETNPAQLAKFNVQGNLMEIMDAFAIGKVKINIAPFNTQTHKQIAMNSFYLDFNDWFSLSQRIQTGSLLVDSYNEHARDQQAKSIGQKYFMQDMFIKYGGTHAKKLKPEKQRNGKDEARVFRVFSSYKSYEKIMFSIATGDGHQGKTGTIEPDFKPMISKTDGSTVVTQMPVDFNDLRGACQYIDYRIHAYIIQQQIIGAFASPYQSKDDKDNTRAGISNEPLQVTNLNEPKQEADNVTVYTTAVVENGYNAPNNNGYNQQNDNVQMMYGNNTQTMYADNTQMMYGNNTQTMYADNTQMMYNQPMQEQYQQDGSQQMPQGNLYFYGT